MNINEAMEDTEVVQVCSLLTPHMRIFLFDSGATKSFISEEF